MTDDISVESLLEQVRQGCPVAGRELFGLCNECIHTEVKRRLNRRDRLGIDPDDLVQETWTIFFDRVLPRRSFDSIHHLRAFLRGVARVVLRRGCDRRTSTSLRSVPVEQLPYGIEELPTRVPDPEQTVLANDLYQVMLQGQPIKIQLILELRRIGFSVTNIADALETNTRAVHRIVRRIGTRFRS